MRPDERLASLHGMTSPITSSATTPDGRGAFVEEGEQCVALHELVVADVWQLHQQGSAQERVNVPLP